MTRNTDNSDSHAELMDQVRRSLGITTGSAPQPADKTIDVQQSTNEPPEKGGDYGAPTHMVSDEALAIADQILGIPKPRDHRIFTESPSATSAIVEVNGTHYQVKLEGIILGRRPPPNGIIIDNARISRQHAKLLLMEDRLAVIDLEATNGTMIVRADHRLEVRSEPVLLESGDRLATTTGYPIAEIKIYPQG